jgi:hypothetical protein
MFTRYSLPAGLVKWARVVADNEGDIVQILRTIGIECMLLVRIYRNYFDALLQGESPFFLMGNRIYLFHDIMIMNLPSHGFSMLDPLVRIYGISATVRYHTEAYSRGRYFRKQGHMENRITPSADGELSKEELLFMAN